VCDRVNKQVLPVSRPKRVNKYVNVVDCLGRSCTKSGLTKLLFFYRSQCILIAVFIIGRDFELRNVPSCGFNKLTNSQRRDRQLEIHLDKFYDIVERRNSHDSVRIAIGLLVGGVA